MQSVDYQADLQTLWEDTSTQPVSLGVSPRSASSRVHLPDPICERQASGSLGAACGRRILTTGVREMFGFILAASDGPGVANCWRSHLPGHVPQHYRCSSGTGPRPPGFPPVLGVLGWAATLKILTYPASLPGLHTYAVD